MKTFKNSLRQLKEQNRYRSLSPQKGIDFSSNDYLGLSTHPALRETAQSFVEDHPLGAGGSRLLRGNHPAHESLEVFAAQFFRSGKALFFANGFLANYTLLTTLPNRHDTIIYDALVHASMREGIQASKARSIKAPHNDLHAFEEALKKAREKSGALWLAVESVYSMDGDIAPLADLYRLAQQYEAYLIVDEAHATGIFGPNGKGVSADLPHDHLITLHTCGKALGVAGGIICASETIIDYMINKSRAFIYSTAPMPLQAALVENALKLVQAEPWRREKLFEIMDKANKILPVNPSPSQIIPVHLGDEEVAIHTAQFLQDQGFDIRAIRPPTVPEGASRLRLSLNVNITEEELLKLLNLLNQFLERKAA